MGNNKHNWEGILSLLPQVDEDALRKLGEYCAPEAAWYLLTSYVNDNVTKDSTDDDSVAIYAALSNREDKEMKRIMVKHGY